MNAEVRKEIAKVIARAWTDSTFKERLLHDPAAVLKENGICVTDEEARSFTLPPAPVDLHHEPLHAEMGVVPCPQE